MTVRGPMADESFLDPLHDSGSRTAEWTTVNAAEALPGVATPLTWAWYFAACELAMMVL